MTASPAGNVSALEDQAPECSKCGSTNVSHFDYQGTTGVSAPDGYQEPWNGTVRHCFTCGLDEEI
jgi:hypothetical protein